MDDKKDEMRLKKREMDGSGGKGVMQGGKRGCEEPRGKEGEDRLWKQ